MSDIYKSLKGKTVYDDSLATEPELQPEVVVSIKDYAKQCHVTQRSVQKWIATGQVQIIEVNGKRKIDASKSRAAPGTFDNPLPRASSSPNALTKLPDRLFQEFIAQQSNVAETWKTVSSKAERSRLRWQIFASVLLIFLAVILIVGGTLGAWHYQSLTGRFRILAASNQRDIPATEIFASANEKLAVANEKLVVANEELVARLQKAAALSVQSITTIRRLNTEITNLRDQANMLKANNNNIVARLEKATASSVESSATIVRLNTEITDIRDRTDMFKTDNNNLVARLENASTSIGLLNTEIKDLRNQTYILKADNDRIKGENDRLKGENARFAKDVARSAVRTTHIIN